jgi:hypothetical protein
MALAGRSARRGAAGFRWIAVGLTVTLFLLLIDASLNSKSVAPSQQLAAGAWYDDVLPLITASNAEGAEIAGLWSSGLSTPAASIASRLESLVTGSNQIYQEVSKLRPPVDLTGPAGLLEACLVARSQATVALRQAFMLTLGAAYPGSKTAAVSMSAALSGGVSPELQDVATAQARMDLGDQAYQLFAGTMPKQLGLSIPSSVWLANAGPYQAQNAEVFLASLQNSVNTSPVHELKIYALTTDPAPVTVHGTTEVLPDASSLLLNLVVADVGNQTEDNLTVTASISPATAGSASVRDFVNLDAGQSHTIVELGPLNPPEGVPVTLTVTVTPPSGSPTPVVNQVETFEMPGSKSTPTTVAGG